MENKDELKKIDIKNCTCYYFDDTMKAIDSYLGNILLDEKMYKNILIYGLLYKTFIGSKPLHIWFIK